MTTAIIATRHWPLSQRLPAVDRLPASGESWLTELSAMPRMGLRGPGTADWLAAQGMPLAGPIDRALDLPGLTLVPLGAEEAVILPDPHGDPGAVRRLRDAWRQSPGPKGFDAYRDETWAWFRLTGPAAEQALPLLTALDTRPAAFPAAAVAQTRVMHMDAVILRSADGGALDLLFDIASSGYALDFIEDVIPGIRTARLAV